jgi:hypothetical protein
VLAARVFETQNALLRVGLFHCGGGQVSSGFTSANVVPNSDDSDDDGDGGEQDHDARDVEEDDMGLFYGSEDLDDADNDDF